MGFWVFGIGFGVFLVSFSTWFCVFVQLRCFNFESG